MGKFLLLLTVLLISLMVAAVLAYQYGGILGLIGLIVAVILLAKLTPRLVGALMFRSLRKAIDATGEALRGATIEVHSVEPTGEPPPDEDDIDDEFDDDFDEDDVDEHDHELLDTELADLFYDGPRNWYLIDLTVLPPMRDDGRPTEYQPWSPHMLMLLGPAREMPEELGPMAAFAGLADGVCDVRRVEVWRDGVWTAEDYDEEEDFGPQRIRLLAGVKPGETHLRLGYVSEVIGEVHLPSNSL